MPYPCHIRREILRRPSRRCSKKSGSCAGPQFVQSTIGDSVEHHIDVVIPTGRSTCASSPPKLNSSLCTRSSEPLKPPPRTTAREADVPSRSRAATKGVTIWPHRGIKKLDVVFRRRRGMHPYLQQAVRVAVEGAAVTAREPPRAGPRCRRSTLSRKKRGASA